MNNTKPKFAMGIPIAPQVTYSVGGRSLTGSQIAQAIEVCIGISRSYALADAKNGGNQQILWEGLDEVAESSDRALGAHLESEVNDWAKRENGFEDLDRLAAANDEPAIEAERKKSDDTEGGACD